MVDQAVKQVGQGGAEKRRKRYRGGPNEKERCEMRLGQSLTGGLSYVGWERVGRGFWVVRQTLDYSGVGATQRMDYLVVSGTQRG